MYASFIPPSQHTVLGKFHSSPFLTKLIILEICLVCLVFLPLLAINIADFIYNIIIGTFYGTTYVPLFNKLLFSILTFARAIPEVHTALYSLSALD